MEEWGIWREWAPGDGEWWTDKSGLVFHTSAREVAEAQLEHMCKHWLAMRGPAHFSIKSFLTHEVWHTRHPGRVREKEKE